MISPQPQVRRLKVFISYATENRAVAEMIFHRLNSEGFAAWYDQLLLPGQRWEAEIEANQKSADIVVIVMSRESVGKRGFVQREAVAAVKKLDEMLPNDIYIIPVRLDDCTPPEQISSKIQFIDWKRDDCWLRILASLKSAASARGIAIVGDVEAGPFRVRTAEVHEFTTGPHSYQHSIEYPEFSSSTASGVAEQLTSYFSSRATQSIIDQRSIRWRTEGDVTFNEDGSSFSQRSFHIAQASSTLISVLESTHLYAIGAAHGNQYFDAHNFCIKDGQIIPFKLPDLLENEYEHAPLKTLSKLVIEKLIREYWEKTGEEIEQDSVDQWFAEGAGEKWENFNNFTVSARGIQVHFAPYEVHAYVYGSWQVEIPFFELRDNPAFKPLFGLAAVQE